MAKLVTIYGGSGFVGRYVAQRMARRGWRVRVAVRRPNEAMFVKPYGVVGQVEPVLCNIRDDASVREVMMGADAVVNCVGILEESGKNKFDAVQHEGAERIAKIAKELGVETLVHVSAIGANQNSDSKYAKSKGLGEAGVLDAFPSATIVRPSIVFGPEDQFFNRFAAMARMSPVIPLFGADTKFQPVYVDDVAHAVEQAATGEAASGIYELGGPETMSFRELIEHMLSTVRRRRLVLGLPLWLGRFMGHIFDFFGMISGGLLPQPLTHDQAVQLANDNVVSDGAMTFEDLGIRPIEMDTILPSYLWQFRPSGQYSDIKESAKKLKG
ncbi:MAG: complex I NDUFA9 subunit family protein [Boseongicola sp.]|nr:complex I NDUFA9 subunit family protein [Boseongicola sp.]MDD9976470.1 complex I NDUFA9 subunit family protein [Boseongicola sp.]